MPGGEENEDSSVLLASLSVESDFTGIQEKNNCSLRPYINVSQKCKLYQNKSLLQVFKNVKTPKQ